MRVLLKYMDTIYTMLTYWAQDIGLTRKRNRHSLYRCEEQAVRVVRVHAASDGLMAVVCGAIVVSFIIMGLAM